jgi:hypothetical protein
LWLLLLSRQIFLRVVLAHHLLFSPLFPERDMGLLGSSAMEATIPSTVAVNSSMIDTSLLTHQQLTPARQQTQRPQLHSYKPKYNVVYNHTLSNPSAPNDRDGFIVAFVSKYLHTKFSTAAEIFFLRVLFNFLLLSDGGPHDEEANS